jgi:hypothetical protein
MLGHVFQISRFVRQLAGVLPLLVMSSCAVSVQKSPLLPLTLSGLSIQTGEVAPDIARIRVAYLASRLEGELQARGYVLAQPNAAAPDSLAPGIYPLKLHALSYSRNNALAGYYNSLSLALEVLDQAGRPLLRLEDTISQRGGLLLNAGQVLRGLSSSVANLDETQQFEKLADKLLQRLARELPAPAAQATLAPFSPRIGEVEISPLRAGIVRFCVAASFEGSSEPAAEASTNPDLRAVLALGALRSPLSVQRSDTPDTAQQHFCGNFPVSVLAKNLSSNFLEFSDRYGRSSRVPIPQLEQLGCAVQPELQAATPTSVLLSFTQSAAGSSTSGDSTSDACAQAKILVFRQQKNNTSALPASFTRHQQLALTELEKQPLSLGLSATNERYGIIIKDRYGNTQLPVYTKE